jgi:hypothetical protein
MPILNNLHTHSHIDALLFYIYDAVYVIANSIARQPFGLGKADRGQSLLFHDRIGVGETIKGITVTGLDGVEPCSFGKEAKTGMVEPDKSSDAGEV